MDNLYFRDLACRQNHEITEAEMDLYLNTKRYFNFDIEKTIEFFKTEGSVEDVILMKTNKQLDLNGKIAQERANILVCDIEQLKKELEHKTKELENIKNLDFKNVENGDELEKRFIEKLFVYQRKLVIIDNENNVLMMKHKPTVFDDLICEFKKLYDWLDDRSCHLEFNDKDGSELIINKDEVDVAIQLFDKLNKMKVD